MDLAQLTPDQLTSLKAQLGITTDASGRSPLKPRQLHDLRLLPTKDDPRPTFFWSAESPRDAGDLTKTSEFPKLLFAATGEDITVNNADEQAARIAEGYLLVAPVLEPVVVDPMDTMRAELDALSDEDRAALIEAQRQDRIKALQAKMAALPESSLESLLTSAKDRATEGRRGPGRPRKEQVA